MALAHPQAVVRKYDDTFAIFERFSWDYDHKTDASALENLYRDLGVTHVLESVIEEPKPGENIRVHAKLVDVFTGREIPEDDVTFGRQTISYYDTPALSRGFRWLLQRQPNDFGLNLTGHSTQIDTDDANPYHSEEMQGNSSLDFLSGVSIRRVQGPDGFKNWGFHFEWVPAITLSERQLRFNREFNNNVNGKSFEWISGYGDSVPSSLSMRPSADFILNLSRALA